MPNASPKNRRRLARFAAILPPEFWSCVIRSHGSQQSAKRIPASQLPAPRGAFVEPSSRNQVPWIEALLKP